MEDPGAEHTEVPAARTVCGDDCQSIPHQPLARSNLDVTGPDAWASPTLSCPECQLPLDGWPHTACQA